MGRFYMIEASIMKSGSESLVPNVPDLHDVHLH